VVAEGVDAVPNDLPSVTLVEALEIPLRDPTPRKCLYSRVRHGLAEEEQIALDRALDRVRGDDNNGQRKVYSSAWLANVLTSQGHPISSATIQRHIRDICSCLSEETTGE
jgi:hypothetical protein